MKKIAIILFAGIMFSAYGFEAALGGNYSVSAHGDSTAGVARTSITQYTQGHCGHCHEMHSSIDGAEPTPASGDASGPDSFCFLARNFDDSASHPYAQDDNGCFYCHATAGSLQFDGIINKLYSDTFAGGSNPTITSIFDAFNQSSYHHFDSIDNYAITAFSSFYKAGSNPCCACHNVHLARRNKADVDNPSETAISMPSDHFTLWGDGDTEQLNDHASPYTYQPPYYNSAKTTYEPDNSPVNDNGADMPDYNSFCLTCHVNAIQSQPLARNTKAINWTTSGNKHGKSDAAGDDQRNPPYQVNANYVLSCLDCHEPHGSPSYQYLIRPLVNGEAATVSADTRAAWENFCQRCHTSEEYMDSHNVGGKASSSCTACHDHANVNF